jgi:DNA polymerase III subunit delta'
MQFKTIIGHKKIKEKLVQTAVDGRISHAQLFLGAEGSGNLPMAIAYATYISCLNRTATDACGTCSSCIKYDKIIHPDLHFAYPVNKGKLVSKDPVSDDYLQYWREFLLKNPYFHESQWYEFIGLENKQGFISAEESQQIIKKLSLKPYESDYKIMVIWLPEKMNPSSANKLLKLIEEPSDNTVILLVSHSVGSILPTILSRVQLVKFNGVDENELRTAFEEKHQIIGNVAEDLVHLSNGNYLSALDIINSNEEINYNLDKFSEFSRICFKNDIRQMIDIIDEIATIGRERQKNFLEYSLKMFRENLVMNFGQEKLVYLDSAEKKFSVRFSPYVNQKNGEQIHALFSKALTDIESNANARIVFMDIALKLHPLLQR